MSLQKFLHKLNICKKQQSSMPLKKGPQNIGKNIQEIMSTGRSRAQAIAISLQVAGKSAKRKH
jgi:hypothetical protein